MLWIPDSRYWIPDSLLKELGVRIPIVKGRTIRKLIRGGEAKYQKKYSRKGKLNEKIHARQLTLKNIHAMA